MSTPYSEFLGVKRPNIEAKGIEPGPINPLLYPFQQDLVRWACKRGQAAIFADCGLGKSYMQIEWARLMLKGRGRCLIVAPIAVGHQTIAEGAKLGVEITRVEGPLNEPGIHITNYERLHKFVGSAYQAIVLDESSILKSMDGKTRTLLIKEFSRVPYRLCCTATPAPNDVSELANHAEFLGAMSRVEMLATFFVHDSDEGEWRLKGHAAGDMWRWMAQWARFARRPSDLGYPDDGWTLPALSVKDEVVQTGLTMELGGIGGRGKARKATMQARIDRALEILRSTPGQWLVWCGLNDEQHAMEDALGSSAVSVEGATPEDKRIEYLRRWCDGEASVLIAKPSVFGFGLNLQNCHQVLFLGLGDSYEAFYQSIRRCWRHGQKNSVDVRIVISDIEGAISENVKRKEEEAKVMAQAIIDAVAGEQTVRENREDVYEPKEVGGTNGEYALMLGDCVERIKEVPDACVGFSVYSPPFASLYTYSSSTRDMGHCRDYDQFFKHYAYLIPEILRVTKPGRRTAVHVAQTSTTKATHGVMGWRDFRADVVKAYVAGGWIYDGEVVIDKCPQAQAIRTKSKQLMFVQKERDSSWLRPAMADYILLFRHPVESKEEPVKTDVTNEEWILFARPIWYGIRETGVLRQYRHAREDQDEKHIAPLQLETIERCIRLWSNPGDVVLSPFCGIGSEGYVSLKFGRKFIGIELKESYWKMAQQNLELALSEGLSAPTVPVDLPVRKVQEVEAPEESEAA
jgi:DNA modification methylase